MGLCWVGGWGGVGVNLMGYKESGCGSRKMKTYRGGAGAQGSRGVS